MNTIHLIDDDPAIRHSLSLLLMTEGYEVRTHEAAQSFLDEIDSHARGCVVTDVCMPDMTGIELLVEMKQRRISLPVIVISAHADVSLAVKAMKEGAIDFIEKPFDDNALFASVRAALAESRTQNSREEERRLIRAKLGSLTEREKEVLAALLKGQPNKIIAHELGIGTRTVESHRASVMAKMGAASLSELVRMSLLADDVAS